MVLLDSTSNLKWPVKHWNYQSVAKRLHVKLSCVQRYVIVCINDFCLPITSNYTLSHREPLVQSVSAEGRDEGITPPLPDKYLHNGAVAVRG